MRLNYKVLGEGEPLIILHGLFGMLDNWVTLGKQFAKHFKVYLIDQRNHGKSPHTPEHNYHLLAEDLLSFMALEEIPAANILGHSMGGKTAMQFAINYPNRTKRLIVVDIAPKDYPTGHEDVFEAFFSLNLDQIKSRKEADEQLQSILPSFSVRQFILKNLTRNSASQYSWKPNYKALQQTYPTTIQNSLSETDRYMGSTLFIKGGQSERYIELKDWPMIQSHFPTAQLSVIEESGHWIHAEKPQDFYETVMAFTGVSKEIKKDGFG